MQSNPMRTRMLAITASSLLLLPAEAISQDCEAEVSLNGVDDSGYLATIIFDVDVSPCARSVGTFEYDLEVVERASGSSSSVPRRAAWEESDSASSFAFTDSGGGIVSKDFEVADVTIPGAIACTCSE